MYGIIHEALNKKLVISERIRNINPEVVLIENINFSYKIRILNIFKISGRMVPDLNHKIH